MANELNIIFFNKEYKKSLEKKGILTYSENNSFMLNGQAIESTKFVIQGIVNLSFSKNTLSFKSVKLKRDLSIKDFNNKEIHNILTGSIIELTQYHLFIKTEGFQGVVIIKRSNIALNEIKDETLIDIFNIYNKICFPYSVKRLFNDCKKEAILNLLKHNGINYEVKDKIGILIPSKKEATTLLVNHYDLIPSFDKGFILGKGLVVNKNKAVGALDNTIVNSIVLDLLIKDLIPDNVECLFTDEEELGYYGAKRYIECFKQEKKHLNVINLDTTEEWKRKESLYGSFEIVANSKSVVSICKEFKGLSFLMKEYDYDDDLTPFLNNGFKGFSFCLPTLGDVHKYSNSTKLDYIKNYSKGLLKILTSKTIVFKKSTKKDIYHLNSLLSKKKFLNVEKLLKFDKKRKKNVKKSCYQDSSFLDFEAPEILDYPLNFTDNSKINAWEKSLSPSDAFTDNVELANQKFVEYFHIVVSTPEAFFVNEKLVSCLKEKDIGKNLIEFLDEHGVFMPWSSKDLEVSVFFNKRNTEDLVKLFIKEFLYACLIEEVEPDRFLFVQS